ncbi:MAG: 50S ribosomal protein L24 [Thermaerobacter sp.]|nr:50S ribosomal protein L24 [Thermaerobacter sp.]
MSERIRKGDQVEVIAGKDKGRRGTVLRVVPKDGRVVVEGLNKHKRHQKATQQVMQAGIITREGPIHLSNVMPYCSHCGKPARVAINRNGEVRERVCRSCGNPLGR